MPNHITNILHINGPRSDIDQIIGPNTNPELFTFKYVVPYPPEATDESWDWYNWQVTNWGTKWDAYETCFISNELNEDNAEIHFQTAWSPPVAWLASAIERFPNIEFKLYWLDEDYPTSGQILASNGQITKNEYYGNDRDTAIDFVKEYFYDIYEMFEKHYRLHNLIEEMNEVINEYYSNVQIEIVSDEYNDNTDQNEPLQFKVKYIEVENGDDVLLSLNKNIQKEIMRFVRKIISDHGYMTTIKGQFLDVKK
jgi:hypothetical protein